MNTNPDQEDPRRRRKPEPPANTPRRAAWVLGIGSLLLLAWTRLRRSAGFPPPESQPEPSAPIPREPTKGHEHSDGNPKWIFAVILFILVFGLSLHGILAGFLGALKRSRPPSDLWRPLKPTPGATALPRSFPVLQVSPPLELQTFRAREENELQTYGWVDRKAGVVRIPIERAMDVLLQQGLPARATNQAHQLGPSSYQLIEQRPLHRQNEIQDQK